MRTKLGAQSPQERTRKSRLIQDKLFKLDAYRNARTICFFVGMDEEVQTVPMIESALSAGKRVLVPRTDLEKKELKWFDLRDLKTELAPGALGILEPTAKAKAADASGADCVLVPGLAFDKKNNRLGRGKGFYDRFFSSLPSRVFKVGLAFSFQLFPEIPHEARDHALDAVLTD